MENQLLRDQSDERTISNLSIWKRFILCGVIVVLLGGLFGGLEVLLRCVRSDLIGSDVPFPILKQGQIARYVEKFHWRLIPNSIGYTKSDIEYKINSLGMRSPEIAKQKPNNTVRLLFMGDSIIFGWQVPGAKSLPAQIYSIYQARYPRINLEVMNCGVIGYSSLQGRLEIDRWLEFSPDMVFITYGWNDSMKTNSEGKPDSVYHQESLSLNYQIGSLLKKSALLTYLVRAKSTRRNVSSLLQICKVSNDVTPPRVSPEEYRHNLSNITNQIQANKITPVFIPISVPDLYLDQMIHVASQKQIRLLNLDPVLADYERKLVYLDRCHPTSLGYTLLATKICDAIDLSTASNK